jgi:hypothetical protein
MYVDPELIGIPIIIGIPAIVVTIKMYLTHKEKMAGPSAPREHSTLLDARLERVEQTVESIAIEMERVSEGQRFVTKLLSERAREVPGAPPQGRVNTPH